MQRGRPLAGCSQPRNPKQAEYQYGEDAKQPDRKRIHPVDHEASPEKQAHLLPGSRDLHESENVLEARGAFAAQASSAEPLACLRRLLSLPWIDFFYLDLLAAYGVANGLGALGTLSTEGDLFHHARRLADDRFLGGLGD